MNSYDLSPLFRSTIGFDRLSQLIDTAFKADERAVSYPPYNIVKTAEDDYQIVMAVAGFSKEDITITAQQNMLLVTASQNESQEDGVMYLHKGIATRSFERKFSLADHVKVVDAKLDNGLLTLFLKREVPEASKPRTIQISTDAANGNMAKTITKKAS